MGKNTSITLGTHFADFVESQVGTGRYGSASEVIRAGLRLLEEHEVKLLALRNAIDEGARSGPAEPIDVDDFVAERTRERERA